MTEKPTPKKINMAAGKAFKILIECCLNNGIQNPSIEFTADVTDGSKYRLFFERIDHDDKPKEVKP